VIAAVVSTVALARAPAAAGAPRAPVALMAEPARVALAGSARATVQVTNTGARRVVVDVSRAAFALDLRGRPRVAVTAERRSATSWLTVRPSRIALAPRSRGLLDVTARVPRHAEPGDHDALVLLSTRPLSASRVAARVRLGVVVVVRAPGRIARRLELGPLRMARRGRRRTLELLILNRGNVTEMLTHARADISRTRGRRRVATFVASARDLRPRTRGILEFPFRARVRGRMTVRVLVPAEPGRPAVSRVYRIKT
jgi:hypothetical protein